MDDKPETVTETRVRLYRKALEQLREENALKEAEAAAKKKAEADKEPEGPGSDRPDTTVRDGTDKA